MHRREIPLLIFLLVGVCLTGCTDTAPAGQPIKRFTDLVRGYDRTLTEEEKKRVIEQLREEKERQGLVDPAEEGEAKKAAESAAEN